MAAKAKSALFRVVIIAVAWTIGGGGLSVAHGQEPPLLKRIGGADVVSAAQQYWTPARLAKTQPMRALVSLHTIAPEAAIHRGSSGPTHGEPAQPPTVEAPAAVRLYDPADVEIDADDPIEPWDRGAENVSFTSSRLIGDIHTKFPYSAVGRLFFTTPGGNASCSASVIGRRIVVTAGHCVHMGSGGSGGFFSNFQFVPALKDGVAPFGTWKPTAVAVTVTWGTGGGFVPNAADYAMLEMKDKPGGVRIGDVTGVLGFQTASLVPNHATMLGYPCNLDQCQQMHQVTAGSVAATSPNNAEYGSDAGAGQNGGPFIQNFGKTASGQSGGLNGGENRVIGVVSYGYASSSVKAIGGSIPDTQWSDMFNAVCALRAGNC